jgi:hypothetical protein
MAKQSAALDDQANEGYTAEPGTECPYFTSSASGLAWLVGQWLNKTGRPAPADVRMSRGCKVRVGDMLIDAGNPAAIARVQ